MSPIIVTVINHTMNEEDFIREMNEQDMDNENYDDYQYEIDIDYTTES